MRILLGVNEAEQTQNVVNLLSRLRFPHATVDAVHVIETVQFPGRRELAQGQTDLIARYQQTREETGRRYVEEAAQTLKERGLAGKQRCLHGFVAHQLMDYADDSGADLIAIGSRQMRSFEAFMEGSVSRGLVIGAHKNLLVVKGKPAFEGPVTAVLATDHSIYMSGCIDKLAEMAPQGINRLIVVTAYEWDSEGMASLQRNDPDLMTEWTGQFEQRLHERNQAIGTRLRGLGAVCETRVLDGPPIPAINSVMSATGAELLILGAQGHGVVERVTVGSVSFHAVMSEPYSVLVLRTS